jgi:hypothetical protein
MLFMKQVLYELNRRSVKVEKKNQQKNREAGTGRPGYARIKRSKRWIGVLFM